jgi:hypothetical protein
VLQELLVRGHAEVGLAQHGEACYVKDGVRVEILQLHTVVEKYPPNEWMQGEPEATLIERGEI